MAWRNRPTPTPLSSLTDNQIAAQLDQLTATAPEEARGLLVEAARRLRSGGGVHISDSVAGGDIIATSHRHDR